MSYFGATYIQVSQALQGADTDNTLDTGLFGGQTIIEEIMAQQQAIIFGWMPDEVSRILLSGKIEGQKVIDNCQDATQTLVDKGQEFIGIVNELTLRVSQNQKLTSTDRGIDSSYFSLVGNVLSITADKYYGDVFRAYYSFDPETLVSNQLASLLIKMSSLVLARREIIGGSGEDDGLSDIWQSLAAEIQEQLAALKQCECKSTYITALLGLNLDEEIAVNTGAKIISFGRGGLRR